MSLAEVLHMLRGPWVAVGTAPGVWGSVACSGGLDVPTRWGTGQYWSPAVAPLDARAGTCNNI